MNSGALSPRLTSLLQDIDSESASVLAKSQAAGLVIGRAGTPSQQEMTWCGAGFVGDCRRQEKWHRIAVNGNSSRRCGRWVPVSLEPNGCVSRSLATGVNHGISGQSPWLQRKLGQVEVQDVPCIEATYTDAENWLSGPKSSQRRRGALWPCAVCRYFLPLESGFERNQTFESVESQILTVF